jgi:Fe-S oxidoreductase
MKICIVTTPIRPVPTNYPPFGSMAIIQSLRSIEQDVSFYNIDYHRYTHEQNLEYFKKNNFDAVGISAVVSTAYKYSKYLAHLIKKINPNTIVFLGGGMAASAEILHRKSKVDYCVVGDGEIIVKNLIKALQKNKVEDNDLEKIRGITFIDSKNTFKFTGYEHPLPAPL